MTVSYSLINTGATEGSTDGAFGFSDGVAEYITGGWGGGTNTRKSFHKSVNGGVNFTQQSDFLWNGHSFASCIVNGVAYVVGGDVYSPINDGGFIKKSAKFESGTWSQISADCGIENRCIAALVYLNDDFYLIGGQEDTTKATAYHTVLKSTDGCANFTSILADSTPYFKGGLTWGAFCVYKGEIWRVTGGVYTDSIIYREHRTAMHSSVDGINWTYRGEFRGLGRNYPQLIVYNEKIWVIGGYNGCYGGNLADIWTIEVLASGKIVQNYVGVPDFSGRHAQTCWINSDETGILMFGGTTNSGATNECWLITE